MSRAYMDRDGLHIDDEALMKAADKMSIAATLIEGMLHCPAKALFDKFMKDDVIPPQPDSPLVRGIAFHRTMELYYGVDEDKRGSTVNTAIMNAAMKKALNEAEEVKDNPAFKDWLLNAVKRYVNMPADVIDVMIADYIDDKNMILPGLEMPVSGYIGNATRHSFGKIDRLIRADRENENNVIIDDYKTGRKAEAYDPKNRFSDFGYIRQQTMYAMLLENDRFNKDLNVVSGRLIYPVAQSDKTPDKPGVVLDVDVKNARWRKQTIHDVETVSSMVDDAIDTNTFGCNPGNLCSWCPLVNICPRAYKKEEPKYVLARGNQPTADELAKVIEPA